MRGYAGPCGAMRGYAGLCGAMRCYAGLCGAMVFPGMRLIAKNEAQGQIAIWPQKRRLASKNHLAVKMELWKRIWSWNRDRKNGIGRENGIVKMDMVVKMILAVKWSLWKRQLLNSRVLCMHGSRQAHLAKRLVLQKVWLQTFCNSNSDNYIYMYIFIYILIQWLYEFLRVAFHHHHNIFHGNMDLDMGQIILYHRYRYASLALPWPTLLWGNPFRI